MHISHYKKIFPQDHLALYILAESQALYIRHFKWIYFALPRTFLIPPDNRQEATNIRMLWPLRHLIRAMSLFREKWARCTQFKNLLVCGRSEKIVFLFQVNRWPKKSCICISNKSVVRENLYSLSTCLLIYHNMDALLPLFLRGDGLKCEVFEWGYWNCV